MSQPHDPDAPHPVPLSSAARRCLGVLVEKAKTTPDNYPLSLAAIVAGANQKSNRSPLMQMTDDEATAALDELRGVGAAMEIQGSGRVNKFRHAAYQWLGVDGPGSAIMTELLLRGPQTVGELRTRASRMHPFADLDAVQSELEHLIEKKLVEPLTPAGRGQLFTHTLYPPEERRYLLAKMEKHAVVASSDEPGQPAAHSSDHEQQIDRIQTRLDELAARLETLESRLADWEK